MSQDNPIEVVAGIIWQNSRFLSAERPTGKDYAGWWEFPGGKVESGETLEQALVRELQEELGITASKFTFWFEKIVEYPEYTVRLYFFDVWEYEGEVSSCEGQRFDWFKVSDSPNVKFLPVNNEILRLLRNRESR